MVRLRRRNSARRSSGSSHEFLRKLIHMPMGRSGTIEELAATVAFSASDNSGFITAATIPINANIPDAPTIPAG